MLNERKIILRVFVRESFVKRVFKSKVFFVRKCIVRIKLIKVILKDVYSWKIYNRVYQINTLPYFFVGIKTHFQYTSRKRI